MFLSRSFHGETHQCFLWVKQLDTYLFSVNLAPSIPTGWRKDFTHRNKFTCRGNVKLYSTPLLIKNLSTEISIKEKKNKDLQTCIVMNSWPPKMHMHLLQGAHTCSCAPAHEMLPGKSDRFPYLSLQRPGSRCQSTTTASTMAFKVNSLLLLERKPSWPRNQC